MKAETGQQRKEEEKKEAKRAKRQHYRGTEWSQPKTHLVLEEWGNAVNPWNEEQDLP